MKIKKRYQLVGKVLFVTITLASLTYLSLRVELLWQSQETSSVEKLSNLLISGEKQTKKEAVIEAKSGDVYFPEAKLYLPYSELARDLTYSYDSEKNTLQVSSNSVLLNTSSELRTSENLDALFKKIPKLQSCQRGVTVSFKEFKGDRLKSLKFGGKTKLDSGKTVFMYTEKTCPILNDITKLLKKDISSY